MSGVAVIVSKLAAYSQLTAIVPAARIMAGRLPLGVTVPAIGVTLVSGTPQLNVAMSANRMQTDIVRVTVIVSAIGTAAAGTGYPGLRSILSKVLAACPHTRGTVAGFRVDRILPGIEGPDLPTDAPEWLSGSRDFSVTWRA